MTDTPNDLPDPRRPPPLTPDTSANVRAEIVRAGMTAAGVRTAMRAEGVHISPTTWSDRMADPGSWRLRELEAIAAVLAVPTSALVREAAGGGRVSTGYARPTRARPTRDGALRTYVPPFGTARELHVMWGSHGPVYVLTEHGELTERLAWSGGDGLDYGDDGGAGVIEQAERERIAENVVDLLRTTRLGKGVRVALAELLDISDPGDLGKSS